MRLEEKWQLMPASFLLGLLPTGVASFAAPAAVGAFITGLSGSAHCAVMCGPLACVGLGADRRERRRAAWAWQTGRLSSYVLAGAGLGLAGQAGAQWLGGPVPRVLPWLMAVGLVASAFDVGRRWPSLPGFARIPRLATRWGERFSPPVRAGLRGAITPFLPCGLIYGALVSALGSGSAATGALLMGAFALGGLPALALVQSHLPRLGAKRPRLLPVLRRAVPLLAAAVVVWRALSVSPTGVPQCHAEQHAHAD
jgi:sulfite exporter TauE/SafE